MTALVASSLPSSDAAACSAEDCLEIDITIELQAIDEAPPTLRSVLEEVRERETLPVICAWADTPREPQPPVTSERAPEATPHAASASESHVRLRGSQRHKTCP